jgi:5'-3' exoribonuclease 1
MTTYTLPLLGEDGLKHGLCDGVRLGVHAMPGFPTLHTLAFSYTLGHHGISVFQQESKSESIVLAIKNQYEGLKSEEIAKRLLGKTIFSSWPFLLECKVAKLKDELFYYELDQKGNVQKSPLNERDQDRFYRSSERFEQQYSKKMGVILGSIEYVCVVQPFVGMELQSDGSVKKSWSSQEEEFALQIMVENVQYEDDRFVEKPPPPIEQDFHIGCSVFYLDSANYGIPAEVTGHTGNKAHIRLLLPSEQVISESSPVITGIAKDFEKNEVYTPAFMVAKMLKTSGLALSMITSSMMITCTGKQAEKLNAGLNLKFESKARKVLGYTRKGPKGWELSQKAIDLLLEYKVITRLSLIYSPNSPPFSKLQNALPLISYLKILKFFSD